MRDRSHSRLARLFEWTPDGFWPDAIDETVVHEPCGRPWLVCTSDLQWQTTMQAAGEVVYPDDLAPESDLGGEAERFETQVFYTARAGVRGLPTGHGERYVTREAAVRGHRRWCLMVRLGEVMPDQPPADAL